MKAGAQYSVREEKGRGTRAGKGRGLRTQDSGLSEKRVRGAKGEVRGASEIEDEGRKNGKTGPRFEGRVKRGVMP